MMGWSPRCYIPSFVKIGPPVLEKKIFGGFFVVVCQLHYINTSKQELNGTKAYEETSIDEKSVV